MRLSCTSVMLPSWTLDETFDKLAAHGYQGVELRVRDNPDATSEPSFWGRHIADVSPTNIFDKAAAIRAAAARCGLQVVAFAPRCLVHETDLARRLFEAAIAIDPERPPMVRIGAAKHDRTRPYMPQFDQARTSFETLVEIARHMGVKLLYEIHVGTVAVTASRTRELLADLNPEHIGAIYDVPNMVRVGLEDTRMGLELIRPYLAHCHIGNGILVADDRDENGQQQWKWDFCELREGVADIPQIIRDLQDVGYEGYLSLEEFGPGDEEEKIRREADYLHQLLGANRT